MKKWANNLLTPEERDELEGFYEYDDVVIETSGWIFDGSFDGFMTKDDPDLIIDFPISQISD